MNSRYHRQALSPLATDRVSRRGLIVAAGCCLLTSTLLADEGAKVSPFGVREQDQVWLASTRHIGCGYVGDPAVWKWNAGQWSAADVGSFHKSADPGFVTAIYVHGNRIDDNEGVSGGLAVYQEIVGKHAADQPVRYVIWSWPSARIRGPIKDVRSKAWRSDDEAVLLSRFLAGMDEKSRVGLVCFSYGARIAGGALDLLGSGRVQSSTNASARPQFRVAFWAAAEHNNWLLPGCCHDDALPLGEKWLNLINGCDESLRHYEFLEKGPTPPALGYVGLVGKGNLSEDLQRRWEEWQVSNVVGTTHNYHPYIYSPWIAERTAKVVLWLEP